MMDFSKAPRWRNLVRTIEVVGGGPPREGSQLEVTFDVAGHSRTVVSTIWAYDPPRRLGQRNTEGSITGTFEYRLAPDAGGHDGVVQRRRQAARPDVAVASAAPARPPRPVPRSARQPQTGHARDAMTRGDSRLGEPYEPHAVRR